MRAYARRVVAARGGQFEVVLSSGLCIERLPVGVGARRVWVMFVLSGIDFFAGRQLAGGRFPWETREFVTFEGPHGPPLVLGGGGGGGDAVHHRHYELDAAGLPWLRLAYLDDGRSIATETLRLRVSSRSACP